MWPESGSNTAVATGEWSLERVWNAMGCVVEVIEGWTAPGGVVGLEAKGGTPGSAGVRTGSVRGGGGLCTPDCCGVVDCM